MRWSVLMLAAAVWTSMCLIVTKGIGLANPADTREKFIRLQSKLSKFSGGDTKLRDGLPDPSWPDQHLTQTWSSWHGYDEDIAGAEGGGAGAGVRRGEWRPELLQNEVLELKSPSDKLRVIKENLVQRIMREAKQLPSNNQSIMSIAFLAFGVLLFDVLGDAMFGGTSNFLGAALEGREGEYGSLQARDGSLPDLDLFEGSSNILGAWFGGGEESYDSPQARDTILPGLGLFGDNMNNLAEILLNMITIYLYRDESPDCGERLLCESNQQAVSRGFLDSLVTYVSGFAVSFFLHEAPLSRNLEAMRAGRKGQNCIELYPRCSISL